MYFLFYWNVHLLCVWLSTALVDVQRCMYPLRVMCKWSYFSSNSKSNPLFLSRDVFWLALHRQNKDIMFNKFLTINSIKICRYVKIRAFSRIRHLARTWVGVLVSGRFAVWRDCNIAHTWTSIIHSCFVRIRIRFWKVPPENQSTGYAHFFGYGIIWCSRNSPYS